MEFQINFGTPGVVVGFLILGWLIGTLDLKAAVAEQPRRSGQAYSFLSALCRPDSAERLACGIIQWRRRSPSRGVCLEPDMEAVCHEVVDRPEMVAEEERESH